MKYTHQDKPSLRVPTALELKYMQIMENVSKFHLTLNQESDSLLWMHDTITKDSSTANFERQNFKCFRINSLQSHQNNNLKT